MSTVLPRKKKTSFFAIVFWLLVAITVWLVDLHLRLDSFLKPSIHLDRSWLFPLLFLCPALPSLLRLFQSIQRAKLDSFVSLSLQPVLLPNHSDKRKALKGWLLALGFVFTMTALMGPRWGTIVRTLKRKGIDVVIAVDVSESMLAKDISTGRGLQKERRTKLAMRKVDFMMSQLQGERIGLIVFSGQAVKLCSLTVDYSTCAMWLKDLDSSIIPTGGTAIAETIQMAIPMFSTSGQNSKALFLLTDGDDHSKNIDGSIQEAKKKGVRVYTLGIGSPEELTIRPSDLPSRYRKKEDQRPIRTKLNEALLQKISKVTGGLYQHAGVSHRDIQGFLDHARSTLEKRTHQSQKQVSREARYPIFLSLALFFFLFEISIRERKANR